MTDEFGLARATSLHTDLSLSSLGSITAQQAFQAGHDPKTIWLAVCEAMGVPPERHWGVEKTKPKPTAPF